MQLVFTLATNDDTRELAELRALAADDLTARFGVGQWSAHAGERSVLFGMRQSSVWVARRGNEMVGTFRLAVRKPWAVDPSHFTMARRPTYLTDMAVRPAVQRAGVGRQCLDVAAARARQQTADVIRLDAYDCEAGAGPFYSKCGYREVARVCHRDVPLIYFEFLLRDGAGE